MMQALCLGVLLFILESKGNGIPMPLQLYKGFEGMCAAEIRKTCPCNIIQRFLKLTHENMQFILILMNFLLVFKTLIVGTHLNRPKRVRKMDVLEQN